MASALLPVMDPDEETDVVVYEPNIFFALARHDELNGLIPEAMAGYCRGYLRSTGNYEGSFIERLYRIF